MDRAIWINPDPSYLEERQRLGLDKKDELWDGVLHMVPPPSGPHETMTYELLFALKAAVDRAGLVIRGGTTGVFGSDKNYRVPDISVARPDQISNRGFEGAEVVVEVLSKNDESRDKFPFYAKYNVREVWLVEPKTRAVEMYTLVEGAYVAIPSLRSGVLGVELQPGEKLRVIDGERVVEI
ncbi:MAG TPA: Uma2 family endonuclease [Kofleriaceae bacterium]|nr:Uma2 family endonuclease [Kofleriaceae bacterium]